MAKVFGRPIPIIGLPSPRLSEEIEVNVPRMNGGMVASIDAADIANSSWSLLKNARTRYDKTSRRFGKTRLGVQPDSNKVRALLDYRPDPYTSYLIRVTNSSIFYLERFGTLFPWIPISGSLSGADENVISYVVVLNTLVLANGYDVLKKIDIDTRTVSDLSSSAPRAKYVTSFAERLIAANAGDTGDVVSTIYWSGNRNITEFDASKDISAGNQSLITGSGSVVDPISGIFGFTSVMIIVRHRSIWLATRQLGVASNPFHFYPSVPTVGCEIPGSIAQTIDGIYFFSMEHGTVYKYSPGSPLEDIGRPVATELVKDIEQVSLCASAYNRKEGEYYLKITQKGTNIPKIWVYNERTNAWSYDEVPTDDAGESVTALSVVNVFTEYSSIDGLSGTIDNLTGTIDSLSKIPVVNPVLVSGTANGIVYQEDDTTDKDKQGAGLVEATYTFEARTKEFAIPRNDLIFTYLKVGYRATLTGTITLWYSKDGGSTWTTARTFSLVVGSPQYIRYKKVIRARRLMWRITSADGLYDLLDFESRFHAGGESS